MLPAACPPDPLGTWNLSSPAHHLLPDYGVILEETGFWVVHRRRRFGPFDYQFSSDLNGIEYLYQGEKYGEYCSAEEFFADLKPYQLPLRVTEVAIVVTASLTRCLFQGIAEAKRLEMIRQQLLRAGLERYQLIREFPQTERRINRSQG